jgi:hypothetical protein
MKKLLFLGCNHLQLDYLKAARALGFHVLATDRNSEAIGATEANEFHVAGYLDQDRLLEVAQKSGLQAGDRIFTASAHFAYEGAARLAQTMSLLFPSPDVIDTCLDKKKFYELLETLNIPVPPTRIHHPGIELEPGRQYYLKSDYGKTPHYNYYISNCIPTLPPHDLYYRNCFLLQEEIIGEHFRVNLYGDHMALFITEGGNAFRPLLQLPRHHEEVREKLLTLRSTLGLDNWLLKFDVLMDENRWYVIDLGLDPPMRLRQLCQWQGISFCDAYVRQYLLDDSTALPPWHELFHPVLISGTSSVGFEFDPPQPPKESLS